MNTLTLGAALRIPCFTGTGYENDAKLLMNDILQLQYDNKTISCQKFLAPRMC